MTALLDHKRRKRRRRTRAASGDRSTGNGCIGPGDFRLCDFEKDTRDETTDDVCRSGGDNGAGLFRLRGAAGFNSSQRRAGARRRSRCWTATASGGTSWCRDAPTCARADGKLEPWDVVPLGISRRNSIWCSVTPSRATSTAPSPLPPADWAGPGHGRRRLAARPLAPAGSDHHGLWNPCPWRRPSPSPGRRHGRAARPRQVRGQGSRTGEPRAASRWSTGAGSWSMSMARKWSAATCRAASRTCWPWPKTIPWKPSRRRRASRCAMPETMVSNHSAPDFCKDQTVAVRGDDVLPCRGRPVGNQEESGPSGAARSQPARRQDSRRAAAPGRERPGHRGPYRPGLRQGGSEYDVDRTGPVWPPIGLLSARLTVSPAGAAVANVARPRGIQVWNCAAYDTVTAFDYGDPGEPLAADRDPRRAERRVLRAADGRLGPADQGTEGERDGPGPAARPAAAADAPASAVRVRYAEPAAAGRSPGCRRTASTACSTPFPRKSRSSRQPPPNEKFYGRPVDRKALAARRGGAALVHGPGAQGRRAGRVRGHGERRGRGAAAHERPVARERLRLDRAGPEGLPRAELRRITRRRPWPGTTRSRSGRTSTSS